MLKVNNILFAIFCFIITHENVLAYVDKYSPRDTGSVWDFYLFLIWMGCVCIGCVIRKIINNKNIRVPIKKAYRTYHDRISNKIKRTIDKDLVEYFRGLDNNLLAVKELKKMCFDGLLTVYPEYDNDVIKKCIVTAIKHLEADPKFAQDCKELTKHFNTIESKPHIKNIFVKDFPRNRCLFGIMIGAFFTINSYAVLYGQEIGACFAICTAISILIPICIAFYRDAQHKQIISWIAFVSAFIPLGFIGVSAVTIWALCDKPNIIMPK